MMARWQGRPGLCLGTLLVCASGAALAAATPPADQTRIDGLRARLFSGPVLHDLDLTRLEPGNVADDSRIGVSARWQRDPAKVIEFLRAAGLKWVRVGLNVEGDPSAIFALARVHGLNVLLLPRHGDVLGSTMPQLAQRYVEQVTPLLEQNRGLIRAVQIWNEPSNFPRHGKHSEWIARYGGKWYGGGYVSPFGEFTAAVASALKRRFPDVLLVGGTRIAGSTMEMLRRHPAPLDVVYLQPYPNYQPPEWLAQVNTPEHRLSDDPTFGPAAAVVSDRLRQISGNARLQVWITEIGTTTFVPAPGNLFPHHPPSTERVQAKMNARIAMTVLASQVERVFFFLLNPRSAQPAPDDAAEHFGLVDENWRPKPAYFALARIMALTGGVARADSAAAVSVDAVEPPLVESRLRGGRGAYKLLTHKETVRAYGYVLPDGRKLLAVWSDATRPDSPEEFAPRRVELSVPAGFGERLVAVDLLDGTSRRVETRPAQAGRVRLTLDVPDYPLILLPDSTT